jgi:hypothetical protein
MRRSICQTEPHVISAGQQGTWKFSFTTASPLPKGTKILFDLLSQGRPFEWSIPQPNAKAKENQIWAEVKDKKIFPDPLVRPKTLSQAFEFVVPQDLKMGDKIEIFMGNAEKNPEKGNRTQTTTQRKRPFHLYIDPKGKGEYKEAETFYMDIKGDILKNIRIITPSIVGRNKRFDVIVRFEDQYGNLTGKSPAETLIELSYEHLRENLNWKLFVPETGFITLPSLYFNEPGVYRIQLKNTATKDQFFSAPIKCFQDTDFNLFWGMFHGESERWDAAEQIESCLRFFRDEKALQFYGISAFESEEKTSNDLWKKISHHVAESNEDDRFSAFLGFQYVGEPKEEGLRQFIFSKDNKNLLRKKDGKSNSLKKIYKTVPAKEFIAIPAMTIAKQTVYNFEEHEPEHEPVVEIYNAWGSSECLSKEGNPYPVSGKALSESKEGSITNALIKGCRFGFVAGGLDDRGIYEGLYDSDQKQYTPGLTAVFSKDQTRASIFDALRKRHCYATTGAKIILDFYIAGASMGSALTTKTKPGLAFNRHITSHIIGTAPLKEVQLIRNGKVIETFNAEGNELEISYDDTTPIEKIALPGTQAPFVFYYLRIFQENGHTAWSSPIWVDVEQHVPVKKEKKKTK